MRVAIVHEWLNVYAGAEKVLEQMFFLFPNADLFALVDFLEDDRRAFILNKSSTTTFIQNMPFAKRWFRSYLPLFPLAIQQLDFSGYDLILSSSYAVAKGIIVPPDTLHICYCHSPIRYAWDMQKEYLEENNIGYGIKGWIARHTLHQLRMWDVTSSNGVDYFTANSGFVSRRIRKFYRRDSKVIYPPVSVKDFTLETRKKDFYLSVSRLVSYKNIHLIVEAFKSMPDKHLVIIGDGAEASRLRQMSADAPNIELLGQQPFSILKDYMQKARAFVFAGREDFGIVMVEAQACGTPVIALGQGGALEIVRDVERYEAPTGIFFQQPTCRNIVSAIEEFEQNIQLFAPEHCRENALRFSVENFRETFADFVRQCLREQAMPLPDTPARTREQVF